MKLRTESNTVVLVTSDTVQLKILSLTIDTVITPVEKNFSFFSSFYCIIRTAEEMKSGGIVSDCKSSNTGNSQLNCIYSK